MHTFRDGWHHRASPAHRVSKLRPRPPRDGTGWGACRRGCQAPGLAPLTETWQRETWFTIFIRQTRTRNVNVSAHFQNSSEGSIAGAKKSRSCAVWTPADQVLNIHYAADMLPTDRDIILLSPCPLTVSWFTAHELNLLAESQGFSLKLKDFKKKKDLPN